MAVKLAPVLTMVTRNLPPLAVAVFFRIDADGIDAVLQTAVRLFDGSNPPSENSTELPTSASTHESVNPSMMTDSSPIMGAAFEYIAAAKAETNDMETVSPTECECQFDGTKQPAPFPERAATKYNRAEIRSEPKACR